MTSNLEKFETKCNELKEIYKSLDNVSSMDKNAKVKFINEAYNCTNMINKLIAIAINDIKVEEKQQNNPTEYDEIKPQPVKDVRRHVEHDNQKKSPVQYEYGETKEEQIKNLGEMVKNPALEEFVKNHISPELKDELAKIPDEEITKALEDLAAKESTTTPEKIVEGNGYKEMINNVKETMPVIENELKKNPDEETAQPTEAAMEPEDEATKKSDITPEQAAMYADKVDNLINATKKLAELGNKIDIDKALGNDFRTVSKVEEDYGEFEEWAAQWDDYTIPELVEHEVSCWGDGVKTKSGNYIAGVKNLLAVNDIMNTDEPPINKDSDAELIINTFAKANRILPNQLIKNIQKVIDNVDFSNSEFLFILKSAAKDGKKPDVDFLLREFIDFYSEDEEG